MLPAVQMSLRRDEYWLRSPDRTESLAAGVEYGFVPRHALALLSFCALLSFGRGPQSFVADPPAVCDQCAAWNQRHEPFRVFGNTYYVGVAGLSSVLITSD